MNYYILRALSVFKAGVGFLATLILAFYAKLTSKIQNGIQKEMTRIETKKNNKIANAKAKAIEAAQLVIELEKKVGEVANKESEKAENKLFKLQTKVS